MSGQIMSDHIEIKLGQGQVWCGAVRSGQVWSVEVMSGKNMVWSGQIRSVQSGQDR